MQETIIKDKILALSAQLEKKRQQLQESQLQIAKLKMEIAETEEALQDAEAEIKAMDIMEAKMAFFDKIGLPYEDTPQFRRALDNKWLVTDRLGTYAFVSEKDYETIIQENIKNNTFAHRLSCWEDRNAEFYKAGYVEQFQKLGWNVAEIKGTPCLTDAWGNAKVRGYVASDGKETIYFTSANKKDAREMIEAYNKAFNAKFIVQ